MYYFPICMKTTRAAEYLCIVSKPVAITKDGDPRCSRSQSFDGFATVAYVTMQRNSIMNPAIQDKLVILLLVYSKIQNGAMCLISPTKLMITEIKPSNLSSEIYSHAQHRGCRCQYHFSSLDKVGKCGNGENSRRDSL